MKTKYYTKMLTILLIPILLFIQCSYDYSRTRSHLYGLTKTINPFGIDNFQPYFSWKTESDQHNWIQGGWRIIVADDSETIKSRKGNFWDSKKISSDQQLFVAYNGDALIPGKKYFWRVKVWDVKGRASSWSDIQSFRVPLDYEKDWKADWITYDYAPSTAAPLLRKSFKLNRIDQVASASLYICGLGYYEAYLNGEKIGDRVLEPAQTNYEDYAFYTAYNINIDNLERDNLLGVMLGNGWFNQYLVWFNNKSYGQPVLSCMLKIEYVNGEEETIISDLSWQWREGPITFNNVYAGETYDARKEVDNWSVPGHSDEGWKPVKRAEIFPPMLVEQTMEPIRRMGTIPVKSFTKQNDSKYVFDLGQNFAGWVNLKIEGEKGQKITMRFSEEIDINGNIDPVSTGVYATQYLQTSTYICKGEGMEIWEPRFTYHGFRYVEISGLKEEPSDDLLTGIVVYNSLANSGLFECSSDQINKLHEMARWTIKSNLHGVLTDCPHRERCGWTGDVHAAAPALIYNFNSHHFLIKYIYDMRSSAREEKTELYFGENFDDRSFTIKPVGVPTMIVPGKRTSGTASPDWGTAVTQIPWFVYQFYGDVNVLREFYPDMKSWVDYISEIAVDHIVPHGLGDWCPPGGNANIYCPVPLSSTAFHYLDLSILSRVAALIGYESDEKKYKNQKENVRDKFNERFWDTGKNSYGSQTANVMAVQLGLAPEENRRAIANNAAMQVNNSNGFITTGIFGLGRIFPTLAEFGEAETAYQILTKTGINSFQYMWERFDATTLWEVLPVDDYYETEKRGHSLNHPMNSSYDEWFIRGIAGINFSEEKPGFKKIILRPWFTSWLQFAKGSYQSPYGNISSYWENDGKYFRWEFEIPPNTTADVYVPLFSESQTVVFTGTKKLKPTVSKDKEHPDFQLIKSLGSGKYDVVVEL